MLNSKIDLESPSILTGLSLYVEENKRNKGRIKEIFGNEEKVFFELSPEESVQENEEYFKEDLSLKLKANLSTKGYLTVLNEMKKGELLSNKHESGTRFTKKISSLVSNEDKDIFLQIYSQLKNSYVVPKTMLVFSVAAMDFVNMGIGRNWSTCYAPWSDNYTGGFSTGLDDSSFLIYTTSDMRNPAEKTYRRTATLDKKGNGIILSPSYPYKNEALEKIIIQKLGGLVLGKKRIRVQKIESKLTVDFGIMPGAQVYFDYWTPKDDFLLLGETSGSFRLGSAMFCLNCISRLALVDEPICPACREREE